MSKEGVLNHGQEENKSFVTIKNKLAGYWPIRGTDNAEMEHTKYTWIWHVRGPIVIVLLHSRDLKTRDKYDKDKKQLNCPSFIFIDMTLKMHTLHFRTMYTIKRHSAEPQVVSFVRFPITYPCQRFSYTMYVIYSSKTV